MAQPNLNLVVEGLEERHVRDGFDCGKPQLNTYIQQFASQHQKRKIGKTFVLVRPHEPKVLGFYTLVASSVSFEHMPEGIKLPRYPVPVAKLAQLAVDNVLRRQGWGEYLLFDALARAERISKNDLAIFAVEVDAMDDEARSFYLRYNFVQLKDDEKHMFLPMKYIASLHLNA